MKASELAGEVQKGQILCVGLFLGGSAEYVQVRNKQTGLREGVPVVRETVLTETDAVTVSRWDRSVDPAKYVPPFKKQSRVVVRVSGMQTQSGVKLLTGTIEELQ